MISFEVVVLAWTIYDPIICNAVLACRCLFFACLPVVEGVTKPANDKKKKMSCRKAQPKHKVHGDLAFAVS
jgi:hypothetical protein